MDIKHIAQNNFNRKNEHYSVNDDYIMVEVFGTVNFKKYLVKDGNFNQKNSEQRNYKGLPALVSKDGKNNMQVDFDFNVSETSLYRIDVLYEQYNNIYSVNEKGQGKINTSKDLHGEYQLTRKKDTIIKNVSKITQINNKLPEVVNKQITRQKKSIGTIEDRKILSFDGENDVNKRKILYFDLSEGYYNFQIQIPVNCYFKGMLLRKINKYYANNLDEKGTNLLLHEVNVNNSNMTQPMEASFTIAYDPLLENPENINGLNIIYNDECNIIVKNMNNTYQTVFGGYIDKITENNKQFKITCKDRLKETTNNYIMDELKIQGGTGKDEEHSKTDIHSFTHYRDLLLYLCQLTETTIKSNIPPLPKLINHKNCTVLTFGKRKDIKKVKTSHGKITINNNNIVLRNMSDGLKRQVFHVFHKKKGMKINQFEQFHIHIGMGNPKTSYKYTDYSDTELQDSNAGAIHWTKCGVSPNKKYVMGIGQGSTGRTVRKYNTGYWRSIFFNKCPKCGRTRVLRWDSGRSTTKCIYTQSWNGSKRRWDGGIAETEITCTACDSDFDAVSGWEKMPGSKSRLKVVKMGLKSSKHEQDLLHKGKLIAPYDSNVRVSADDVFRAIKKACKGYTYSTGGSTARYLDKHGNGDCWAWSEKIFNELKKYKVDCIIKEYQAISPRHRSVLYRNSKGEWVDFPYREYNFPRLIRNTPSSKNGRTIKKYTDGGRINQAVNTSSVSSKTQTTEVTVTQGYDISAPFKAYIELTLSLSEKNNNYGKPQKVYLPFTLTPTSDYTITGLKPLFINNVHQVFSVTDIGSKIRTYLNKPKAQSMKLYDIKFITPKIELKKEDQEAQNKSTWYTDDKTTHDHSSCKMILYEIRFDNQTQPEPLSLSSCGKTVNEIMNKIITDGGYLTHMVYGNHRSEDVLYFDDNLNDNPLYTISDEDIMSIGEVNYTPDVVNMSKYIYKKLNSTIHEYVEYCDIDSILLYGENEMINQNDRDEGISSKEAHWFNRRVNGFKPTPEFQYSLTVKGFPVMNIGEYVHINTDLKRLNNVFQLKSWNMSYKRTNKPSITTELGLNEVENKLNVRDILKSIIKDKNKFNIKNNINQVVSSHDDYEWEY